MKRPLISVGVLVVATAAAAGWGMGLLSPHSTPVDQPPAPAPAPAPPKKETAELRTVALMLANSRPAASPTQNPPHNDDSPCGASGDYCGEDAVCVGGLCVSVACTADAGTGVSCAMPGRRMGTCCGERCLDLQVDGNNCGQCGIACQSGLDCVAGRCQARNCSGRMAGTACQGTESGACCRGSCVDRSAWAHDAANCGGCGHACAPGLSCKQGSCIDPDSGAPPSWTCLEMGHACAPDQFCVIDACFPRTCNEDSEGLLCPDPTGAQLLGHCCNRVCTDLYADRNNCRACGVRCGSGEVCKSGECVAPNQ